MHRVWPGATVGVGTLHAHSIRDPQGARPRWVPAEGGSISRFPAGGEDLQVWRTLQQRASAKWPSARCPGDRRSIRCSCLGPNARR